MATRELVEELVKLITPVAEEEERQKRQGRLFYVTRSRPAKEIGDGSITVRTVMHAPPGGDPVYAESEIVCTGPNNQMEPYVGCFDEADQKTVVSTCAALITLSENPSKELTFGSAFLETRHGLTLEATIEPNSDLKNPPTIILRIADRITLTQRSERGLSVLQQFLGGIVFPEAPK